MSLDTLPGGTTTAGFNASRPAPSRPAPSLRCQPRHLRCPRSSPSPSRKGIESSERLGRRRWVVERTTAWLTGYRRLSHRYERHPSNYLALLGRQPHCAATNASSNSP